MRARWLKPEFFRDRKISALGAVPALVYQALWCVADDVGTAPCDADRLKGEMFYFWESIGVDAIEAGLSALEIAGRIHRYRVGDDTYCRITSFSKHQKVHKPSKFRHPSSGQALTPNSASPVPHYSGTPHILDSYTPRHLASQKDAAAGSGAGVVPDYLTRCVVALNRSLQRNPHLKGRAREVATSTQVGKVSWEGEGIPVDVAESVIEERARSYVPNGMRKQIHSLTYFDAAVREKWEEIKATGVTSAADVPGAKDTRDAAWLKKRGY